MELSLFHYQLKQMNYYKKKKNVKISVNVRMGYLVKDLIVIITLHYVIVVMMDSIMIEIKKYAYLVKS